MDTHLLFIYFIVAVALVFDGTNGMHDAANSVATIVATKALSPRQAVAWAACWNFIAFLVFGTAVAKTMGSGLIDMKVVTPMVILGALCGAIGWNLITLKIGLPTSSSHALMGAYAGSAIAATTIKSGWHAGLKVIIISGWIKPLLFIALAPLIGFVLGITLLISVSWIINWLNPFPDSVTKFSRYLQLCSAAIYSLGHGGNDSQKTMGIIASLLFSAKLISSFYIPLWVVLAAYSAIAMGTLLGGWKIMKTMGQGITKLRPIDGVCAETASATSIFLATHLGVPVSTTHVITGAISGVGAAKRVSAVRWNITRRIIYAWVLTIPAAALVAAAAFCVLNVF